MSFRQVVEHYESDRITKSELFWRLMQIVTEDNATEFRGSIPAGLLREVLVHVETCPRTEEGWSRLRTFHMGGFIGTTTEEHEALRAKERQLHRRGVEILRDVFGPFPFREVRVPGSVLSWNDGCVVKLATAIYEERDSTHGRMGVLADALEDAGLTDEDVLSHCRLEGAIHVRGCWVTDLLLGKS